MTRSYATTVEGSGDSTPSLQQVTDVGNTTTDSITASAFITSGGTNTEVVLGDGTLGTLAGGASITSITYSALMTAIAGSALTAGQLYLITDYATVHYITDSSATQYNINTGSNEPLIVLATSTNTLDKQAYSPLYPLDIIYYDPNPSNWLTDNSFSSGGVIVPGFLGVIYFRNDTQQDVSMGYDFRNVLFRRWTTNVNAWTSSPTYLDTPNSYYFNTTFSPVIPGSISGTDQYGNTLIETNNGDGTANITESSGSYGVIGIFTYSNGSYADNSSGADYIATFDYSYVYGKGAIVSYTDNYIYVSVTSNNASTPGSSNSWIQIINLNDFTYWNTNPTSTNNIPSGSSYSDFLTFVENGSGTYNSCVSSTNIEMMKDNTTNNIATQSILGNNIFLLSNSSQIQIYGNTIGAYFFDNTISPFFRYNTIANDFGSNITGSQFNSNVIRDSFFANTTGNYFSSNAIGDYCQYNTVGNSFSNNSIEDNFQVNTIGNIFSLNTIEDNFSYNTIGIYCQYNTIGDYFQENTIAGSFNSNAIGDYCQYNTVGNSFSLNTIGIYCQYNTIGDYFQYNTIGFSFFANTTGNYFNYNTIASNFSYNTVGTNFNSNEIRDNVGSIDFTSATYVYASYSKTLQFDNTNTLKLGYLDNTLGIIVWVNPTS